MGFSERFREAAEAARAKLTEHGVIHDPDAIHGIHAVDPHPHDVDVAKEAMTRGAPDPYSLLTRDEVVALTGVPVGGPSLTYTDDDVGVRFDAEDGHRQSWSFGVHAGHAVDPDAAFDARRWFAWMVEMLERGDSVPGVGDAAVYQDGLLYVLGQGRSFYVLVDAPEGSPVKDWAVKLAKTVLSRFAAGDAG